MQKQIEEVQYAKVGRVEKGCVCGARRERAGTEQRYRVVAGRIQTLGNQHARAICGAGE